jgi:hypothetical protein
VVLKNKNRYGKTTDAGTYYKVGFVQISQQLNGGSRKMIHPGTTD